MKTEYRYKNLPELEKLPARKRIVVFSGAGISVESGVASFRDKDGLWQQFDWKKLASLEGFREDPQGVLDFYNMRRKQLLEIEPNHAHRLLAELEKWHDVTIITQNVDDLHERAGSSNVLHLHGELRKVTSSAKANDPACIEELPLDVPINIGDKAVDGSQLRPYIVWFGERVCGIEKAIETVMQADIFVVIGTSLTVQPAASLLMYAKARTPRFIINPGEVEYSYGTQPCFGYTYIKENATAGVETFIDALIELGRE